MSSTAFASSPDDICLWPCGTWCHRHELADYSHMSDDFEQISAFSPAFDQFFDRYCARFCPLPAPSMQSASLQAPADAGQGVGITAAPQQPHPAIEANRAAWQSIASFLALQNLRRSLERQQRAAAA